MQEISETAPGSDLRICEASRPAQYKMFVLCPVGHGYAPLFVGEGVPDLPPGTI